MFNFYIYTCDDWTILNPLTQIIRSWMVVYQPDPGHPDLCREMMRTFAWTPGIDLQPVMEIWTVYLQHGSFRVNQTLSKNIMFSFFFEEANAKQANRTWG